MRILIATDAWTPQVNGVVRTLQAVRTELEQAGHQISMLSPDGFASIPCPTYPEIRLAFARRTSVSDRIAAAAPEAIHIATEGPLGLAVRRWCLEQGRPFTTAYHTQFPEYLAKRTGLPARWFWRYMSWFHGAAEAVLVSTGTVARQLQAHGLGHTKLWGRGVDLERFRPDGAVDPLIAALPKPVQLYVGRVAVEKNVEAFLESSHPGSKVVVGDGPSLKALKQRFPEILFTGALQGAALAAEYRAADVFVFPSRTDTFGLVMIEALACGTPVAAFPVPGPIDVLRPGIGAMDTNLTTAIAAALGCAPSRCASYGRSFSWAESAAQFVSALACVAPPPLSSQSERRRLAADQPPQFGSLSSRQLASSSSTR